MSFVNKYGANTTEQLKNQFKKFGFTRISSFVNDLEIENLIQETDEIRKKLSISQPERLLDGRILNLHAELIGVKKFLLSKKIISLVSDLIEDTPILCQASTYLYGSEYRDHVDRHYHPTEDKSKECTVWLALEDVKQDAGPFYVVPESHLWPQVGSDEIEAEFPEWGVKRRELSSRFNIPSNIEEEFLSEAIEYVGLILREKVKKKAAQRVPLLLKKGDVVFWNSALVHGGLKRNSKDLTRRALIGNYIGKSQKLWSTKTFFSTPIEKLDEVPHRNIRPRKEFEGEYIIEGMPTLQMPLEKSKTGNR